MSITGAMSAAISGLRATALGSELVSNNISNALTPSYGRREISLSSLSYGATGGVQVNGITRHMNEGVVADRRAADSAQQNSQTVVDFFTKIEDAIGIAGDEDSIGGRLAAFEQSLISAASRPDATERLSIAVSDANRLVEGLNSAAREIQDLRTDADASIADDVSTLNTALQQIEDLNEQIASATATNRSSPALLDQRQVVLDTIGAIVPINVLARDNGAITIYSEGGAILLDDTAVTIGFERQNIVTEFQTLDAGTLSGLTLNGQELRTSALGGGSLEAHFAVRDTYGVEAQSQLDTIARDLVERFEDPSIDATRATGDAGLFTDAGAAFDPTDEVGLSRRLTLNTAVDPDAGGEVWRLRDGVGAVTSGPSGDGTLLGDMLGALESARVPSSSSLGSNQGSMADLMGAFNGSIAATRSTNEQNLSFAAARLNELTQLQLSDGVDTDQELQNLLILEQAYAANARVIQAAEEMLDTLTRL
ncbi:flagellar hook-associated protein FlgK [Sulfitobacter sp.]|uniref:flagellar hook-associated protein FlgK n=1 Tax=Sulfitobacter sp. TaxID=1903071 RepID=UPI003299CA48